jgi:hypothetical protein
MCWALSDWKDIATIVGVVVGLGTLAVGLHSYRKQSKQKRIEYLIAKPGEFDKEERFKVIMQGLEGDPSILIDIPADDKRYFLGFLEEIALLMNSKMIPSEIVHYTFGFFAITCWDTVEFWVNLENDERNHLYWCLFRHFVEQMKREENSLRNTSDSMSRLRKRLKF